MQPSFPARTPFFLGGLKRLSLSRRNNTTLFSRRFSTIQFSRDVLGGLMQPSMWEEQPSPVF